MNGAVVLFYRDANHADLVTRIELPHDHLRTDRGVGRITDEAVVAIAKMRLLRDGRLSAEEVEQLFPVVERN